jgi:2-amino-4-hydroxy-6-hydroxymethyldihydropteridine diphosphokinase
LLRAVVGFGANLGDRLGALRAAAARLPVVRRSRVYETAPVGGPPQPHYLNAAALVAFDGEPLALLDRLLAIELELGRVRDPDVKNGPRTIDLDLLWIDGGVVDDERLAVPHPRLHERAFALAPLLDVAPGAVDPRTGAAYALAEEQRPPVAFETF